MPSRRKELKCPSCGHNEFKRISSDVVRMIDNGAGILDELVDDGREDYTFFCNSCGKDVTNEDLANKQGMM